MRAKIWLNTSVIFYIAIYHCSDVSVVLRIFSTRIYHTYYARYDSFRKVDIYVLWVIWHNDDRGLKVKHINFFSL